jgi:hypothetical protein
MKINETHLPASQVRSLIWEHDTLVDWAGGGVRYGMDGTVTPRRRSFSTTFDAAAISPSGEYVVLYARLGTKGILLRNGNLIREVNRSYYCADAFEYPICMVRLASGREAIIHCPIEYNRLEIDDLETGASLTAGQERTPSDFFHSRLASSPDGANIVSAGWLWNPIDEVRIFDVASALNDPSLLDGHGLINCAWADESSATFLPDGKLAVTLASMDDDEAEKREPELLLFDLLEPAPRSTRKLSARAGTMMAVGTDHLLTLHTFPRLINIATGEIEHEWPHIYSGVQTSSILAGSALPPAIAMDHAGQRFAIASANGITVLTF